MRGISTSVDFIQPYENTFPRPPRLRVHTTLVTFVIESKCGNDEQRSLE